MSCPIFITTLRGWITFAQSSKFCFQILPLSIDSENRTSENSTFKCQVPQMFSPRSITNERLVSLRINIELGRATRIFSLEIRTWYLAKLEGRLPLLVSSCFALLLIQSTYIYIYIYVYTSRNRGYLRGRTRLKQIAFLASKQPRNWMEFVFRNSIYPCFFDAADEPAIGRWARRRGNWISRFRTGHGDDAEGREEEREEKRAARTRGIDVARDTWMLNKCVACPPMNIGASSEAATVRFQQIRFARAASRVYACR